MQQLPVSDTRISSAEFGDFHYKRFLEWAFTERQSKAAFLRNVAVSRTAGNLSQIDVAIGHYCKLYDLTQEELQEYIYKGDSNNVSIAALHDRLEQGLRGEDAWGKGSPRGKRFPKATES